MQLLSRSQVHDFIRQEGLHKLTSVTAYDWDLYILKELIDNALDADEADTSVTIPQINIEMRYEMAQSHPNGKIERALVIEVSNASPFPIMQTGDVFDFNQRVSVKDYYKYPTRGAQGNALKTILGIPYALRYRYWSDYQVSRIPLSIAYGKERVALKLVIDEIYQTIEPQIEHLNDGDGQHRTTIRVNIERFIQRPPRTIEELTDFAQSFALFNPHANFHFEFVFIHADGREEYKALEYKHDPHWKGKYNQADRSPIFWYREDKFRELAFALVRSEQEDNPCSVGDFAAQFGIVIPSTSIDFQPKSSLRSIVSMKLSLDNLYRFLRKVQSRDRKIHLGEIGAEQLQSTVETTDSSLFFYGQEEVLDVLSESPFVLEVALYANKLGKRQLHVGINHTPTYSDPFINKPLQIPESDQTHRGIEKLLDAYDLRDDTSVTLVVHMICPTIEYESFGKNIISDEPYREALTKLIDQVIKSYREATRLPEPIDFLTPAATYTLPSIIESWKGSHYSVSQLLFALRHHLMNTGDENIVDDLKSANSQSRLQAVLDGYQKTNSVNGLIRRQSGRLAVPYHPHETLNIAFTHTNILNIVREYHIRAIIVTNVPGIEDVLIASKYTLRYDVAILRSDGNLSSAIQQLVSQYQVVLTNPNPEDDLLLPQIWVVRDLSKEAIQQTRLAVQQTFEQFNVKFDGIVDFGLQPDDAVLYGTNDTSMSLDGSLTSLDTLKLVGHTIEESNYFMTSPMGTRLESLAPQHLQEWFNNQLHRHNLRAKFIPHPSSLNQIAIQELKVRFHSVIADLAFEHFALDEVQQHLVELWKNEQTQWNSELYVTLEQLLETNPTMSWFEGMKHSLETVLKAYITPQRRQQLKEKMGKSL